MRKTTDRGENLEDNVGNTSEKRHQRNPSAQQAPADATLYRQDGAKNGNFTSLYGKLLPFPHVGL
ncbi:MAG: hypothetical protein R6U20_06620 [Longimonas sp.]|uniref:hypothetical protein n=1 Tax=Longimonas sp. TaxID=2039626 RepID=UPI00397574CC